MKAIDLPRVARRVLSRGLASLPFGGRFQCCLCHRRVRRFLPYRPTGAPLPPVLRDLDVIGSDTENFECPACGCHDRERHLALYLRAAGLLPRIRAARVLHFAPESRLRTLIESAHPAEYIPGDLHPRQAGVRKLDLTAIDFDANRFDFVIANHVLEHVDDDAKALSEIFRVLRPGGLAILQTPFANRLPAGHEDPSIRSEQARLLAYGQEDHCRLYGADLPHEIARFGFVPRIGTHQSLLPEVDAATAGVNEREPLLLFEKPEPA